jgi:hypothetical protein
MIIVTVIAETNEDSGIKYDTYKREMKETNQCYIGNNRRFNKSELLTVNNINKYFHKILCSTHCLEEDIDNAKLILKERILKEFNVIKKNYKKLEECIDLIEE